MYNCSLCLTSALDGTGRLTPLSGRFALGLETVRIVQEAGWIPRLVSTGTKNLAPPTEIRSPDGPSRGNTE